jgi:hypothetical protein
VDRHFVLHIHNSYVRTSCAVYDASNRESFNDVTMWLNEVDVYSTSDRLVKMLVANKIDKVVFLRNVIRCRSHTFSNASSRDSQSPTRTL